MPPPHVPLSRSKSIPGTIPHLKDGERLTREEFERRYDATPNLQKAELIEGIVHIPLPVPLPGGRSPVFGLIGWMGAFAAGTPGVDGGANSSVRLDAENELQLDALLLIDPERGGQARISADDYIESAPELVAEVAASSASYDLDTKLHVYRRNGVREYIVWRVLDGQIDWFVLRSGQFQPLLPGSDGILRSETFPGLWLDPAALIGGDMSHVMAVVQQGLASPEHAAFCPKLQTPSRP